MFQSVSQSLHGIRAGGDVGGDCGGLVGVTSAGEQEWAGACPAAAEVPSGEQSRRAAGGASGAG